MTEIRPNRLLDAINSPADLKWRSRAEIKQIADEVREEVIDVVAVTGGHLGSGLGVVELTVAIHSVFNTPDDRLVWDVGHQCYPHKILTGRRDRMRTLRQGGGLSGFTKRSESDYDPFGAAHAATSISAGLGFAKARDLQGRRNNVVCVIGDGSMSAGMAYEAMNNAGADKSRLIVILNDNDMSIAPPVGAMSHYFSRLVSSRPYRGLRRFAKKVVAPMGLESPARRAEEYLRGFAMGGTMFEEMGFYYIGPVDGHDLDTLLPIIENVRDIEDGPILLHVVTQKGKGYAPAENSADKYHGVSKFSVVTGEQYKGAAGPPTYQKVFGQTLARLGETDERICAITAAMPTGTSTDIFGARFPQRHFDVGIAEQHAVTMAAGMACEGLRPVVAIYSTFLQRAYDQLIHDVGIQNLPVTFVMDRAGIVGADGPTHQGQYDISYLRCVPNFTVMAPKDEAELQRMLVTAIQHDGPCALRIPRGEGEGVPLMEEGWEPLQVGRGELLTDGDDLVIVAYGSMVYPALATAGLLQEQGMRAAVVNARFLRPLDEALIIPLARRIGRVVTMEEGCLAGGFGAAVVETLSDHDVLVPTLRIGIADVLVDHASPAQSKEALGFTPAQMAERILERFPARRVLQSNPQPLGV